VIENYDIFTILTVELELDMVRINQHAKYLDQSYSSDTQDTQDTYRSNCCT